MKAVALLFLFPVMSFASNQSLTCYGTNQQANLQLEFGARSSASVTINDEGTEYEAELPSRTENKREGTVTYSNPRKKFSVTIPRRWEDRGFERFSKHDRKYGFEISEQVDFTYAVRGRQQSITVSECESDSD